MHRLRLLLPLLLALVAPASRAAELDPAPPGSFTIVVIPDTQGYRGAGTKATPDSTEPLTNPVFANHIRWIREHAADQRIAFVTHVGDIVDIDNDAHWALAREQLDGLRGVVPFALTVGNHDMKTNGDASHYQRHFPEESFRDYPWYGGSFHPARPTTTVSGNNVNSYQLFSAGGMDFVHLSLECNAPDDVLAWADEVLTRHANRRALVTTHMDLGIRLKPTTEEGYVSDPKGRMEWVKIHGPRGNSAVQMWDKLFRRHANLGFIFSGDQSRVTALRLTTPGDHGNPVHACLSDYTSSGPLRLYRFLPAENRVQVITFDTTTRETVTSTRYVKNEDQHQFSLPYPMSAR
ncbi:hypothetical protein MASR2M8_06820 [Opitutaceae bacterium]